ncbi:hypothetical protein BH24ACT20_BH24ACT20_17860 [soil metagenome]|jgi:hypothetical protein
MDGLDWKGIVIGAVVAAAINLGAGFLFPTSSGGAADPATIASVVVSFLAYGLGGYIAGRVAGQAGGVNGLMVAVIGFAVGISLGIIVSVVIALAGIRFRQPDPSSVDIGAALAVAGISLALTFVGGYVGGKLGEGSAAA